jgi:hypothetical protein
MHTTTEVQVRRLIREVQRKQPETIRHLIRIVDKYGDVDQPADEDPCDEYDYHYSRKSMVNSRGVDMSPFVEWRNERGDLLIGDDLFRVTFGGEGGSKEDVWFQTEWINGGNVISLVVDVSMD